VAAAATLVLGEGARLAIGGGGVGERSALVMVTLLAIGAWLVARLLGGPRTAFLVTFVLMALFNVAALPPRNAPEYDDVEALYRTDQPVTAKLAVPAVTSEQPAMLTLLAQPAFAAAQPKFSMAGEINTMQLGWQCPFQRGIQRLALPLPQQAVSNAQTLDVRLHLTGSPSRETDYLLVYTSSRRGGVLLSLETTLKPDQSVTHCSLE
jgi:hypothetical protein